MALNCLMGSFPAGAPGNGVPKVILTVGTAFKTALGEITVQKHSVCTKIRLFI